MIRKNLLTVCLTVGVIILVGTLLCLPARAQAVYGDFFVKDYLFINFIQQLTSSADPPNWMQIKGKDGKVEKCIDEDGCDFTILFVAADTINWSCEPNAEIVVLEDGFIIIPSVCFTAP